MNGDALHTLQHTFGFDQFRGRQQAIVETVIEGKNTLIVMPTGGGKSLCYQLPALVRNGVGVVISPLIALMQDQVEALKALNIKAAFLNSTLPFSEVQRIENLLERGEIELLYVAPERLLQGRTIALLKRCEISLFAVDEAHCVAQWGHDFRRDYLELSLLQQEFPDIPRVALTATADERTRTEIVQRLQLDDDSQFICGFDRPNIQYHIRQKNKTRQQLLNLLETDYKDSAGIIYCLSRKKVEQVSEWLQENGINALPYHAGLPNAVKAQNQNRFLREEGIIIVATIAFGMGIDKPNVRFVVHLDMPKSIEAYYQETGRAGRDGDASTAVMFYGIEDVVKINQMIVDSDGNEQFKRLERQRTDALLGLCETVDCRRQRLLSYFGETYSQKCGNCDNCLIPPQTWDATEASQKLLSCIYRTGQRFGVNYIVDVLRGSGNERIQRFGHDQQSTFGIGKEYSVTEWRTITRQLIVKGYINVDVDGYGALQLTAECRPLLRSEAAVYLRKDIKTAATKTTRKVTAYDDIDKSDMPLWNMLRSWRKETSDALNIPPYAVFHDATLKEILYRKPASGRELLEINGIGDAKLEKFGDDVLAIIRENEYSSETV